MGQDVFNYGCQYGFIWAFVLGFTFDRIRANRAAMRARNRPLDTFPDAAQPGSTPGTIVRNSRRAGFLYIFWIIMLIVELIVFWQYTLYLQGFFSPYF